MGGTPKFPTPKNLFSPAGGFWPEPKNWASNTVIAAATIGVVCYGIFKFSIEREERPEAPAHDIISQRWYKPGKFGAPKEI